MARIVDPAAQPRPVARTGGGISRLALPGPSDTSARALQQLGLDIGGAAEEIYRAQKIEEDRINTMRAEDAYNKLRERQLDLTLGDTGYGRLKGSDAVSRPIIPEYRSRFEQTEREIAGTLTNDHQRQRFKARADVARMQFEEGMLRHLSEQGDVYAKQVYEGTIQQAERDATARWDQPHDVASSIARIQSAVRERAERYGWSTEYRDEVQRGEVSKVHAAVITQALANDSYRFAQTWYIANRENIDLKTAAALQKAVEHGVEKEMVAGFNRDFLANRDSRPGLEELAKRVVAADLDETRKNIVHGRILGRIETLNLKAERAQLQQERLVSKAIDSMNGNTFAGMPATIDQMTPIVEAARGTALEADARQMVAIANATGAFARMTPIAQADAISQAEAQIRENPAKFDRRLLTAWKEIHGNQQALLEKDPNTFAERQGITDPSPLDLSKPIQSADALERRFAQTRALSLKYGSPNTPLKELEAKLVKDALGGAGWKERRDYLGELFQASRGDVHGYSGIMAQLAPDHPVTALAGEYTAKGRGQAAELMLAGEDILRPGKKSDGKPDGSGLFPMPPEAEMRAEWDSTVRDAYAGRVDVRNDLYQATKSIYAKLASDKGVKDTKQLDGDLWEQATLLATGGVEKYNGRTLPMPYGMDLGEFRAQVRRRTEDMAAAGALPEGITPEQLQTLPLEPTGDGRYVFRTGTGVLVQVPKGGGQARPLLLDFNQSSAFSASGYGMDPARQVARVRALDARDRRQTAGWGDRMDKAIHRWRGCSARTLDKIRGEKTENKNPARIEPRIVPRNQAMSDLHARELAERLGARAHHRIEPDWSTCFLRRAPAASSCDLVSHGRSSSTSTRAAPSAPRATAWSPSHP